VRVYLEEYATAPVRTSRRFSLHHNTVVYRVQAEELLDRMVRERRKELEIALHPCRIPRGAARREGGVEHDA
jgi:hypothetical protein